MSNPKYFKNLGQNKIQCLLCPRNCIIKNNEYGHCKVRKNSNGAIELIAYGKPAGLAVDPVEKKPLHHFYPGSSVLSFGTFGCNLDCKFCQNHHLSDTQSGFNNQEQQIPPERIAEMAKAYGVKSLAFTYNEPTIFFEFARDVARLVRAEGIKTITVTSGYIAKEPREEFFSFIDAANIDLKSFNDSFYQKLCNARLEPVLDTLKYVVNETDVWTEITTLIIPGYNDSDKEISEMTEWIAKNLGDNVPIHFSAFHPSHKLKNVERTSIETLRRAREIAMKNGIKYVFTGNLPDSIGENTYCHNCQKIIIKRNYYQIESINLDESGNCIYCNALCDGYF